MKQQIRGTEITVIGLTIASIIAAYLLYPHMPEQMASHWNSSGVVDGYMNRFWSLAMMPIVFTIFTLMLLFIPRLDPLKENVAKFRKYFDGFILVLSLFFIVIFGQMMLWNLGVEIDFNLTMPIAMALLLFYVGIMMGKAKRNWFIGIRTPWTLSSDKVWDKTHKLGAKMFKILALITFAGMFLPKYAIFMMVIPLLLGSFWLLIYSYLEFKKLK